MTLLIESLEWAVQFVVDHSDGDLFPRIAEMMAIRDRKAEFAREVAQKPLSSFGPGAHRRFIVPKDDISYRQATQLDPQDSIILSAIVFQFGGAIEARRRPVTQVFSYRFSPTAQHGLYSGRSAWNDFWTTAADRARPRLALPRLALPGSYNSTLGKKAGCILYCDISDFYNQIYHHVIENQLIEAGLPNQATKWVISLLESTTAGVSRGVPIGPHAIHLIAEASLIPVDNSMAANGLDFIRYADDILIFSESERDARRALGRLASILDKQQRLTLQQHKTRFFAPEDFRSYCGQMIEDRPINAEEDRILKLVKKYSGGNPYVTIFYSDITPADWAKISDTIIRKIIEEYLREGEVDFIRLRWFYRRLAQIGHPGAIDVTLENMEYLTPCFASICTYLASIQAITPEQWLDIGSRLLELLDREDVKDNEYFRLSILSLFSRSPHMNHFKSLAAIFVGSDSFAKREILLAAKASCAIDWLREHKEDFNGMDSWQKSAFLYCCHDFPRDERKYFINRFAFQRTFDSVLADWAKSGA